MPEYPTGGAGFSASDQKGNLIAPRGRFKRDPFKAEIGYGVMG